MSILSLISISLSDEVPISLAIFMVMLIGVVLKQNEAAFAVVLYLLLGLVGVPVFGAYTSGVPILFVVTGDYSFGT